MKKLLLLALAGLTIFASCQKEDDEISRVEISKGGTTISGSTLNMIVWEEFQLGAKPFPENSAPKKYKWTSSNLDVASITTSGPIDNYCKVKALKGGETDITVTTDNDIDASFHIIVSEIGITKIELNYNEIELLIGETKELTAKITPNDASFKDLIYTSSDESTVKVKTNGTIEALNVGECQIKVSSYDGKVTAICNVKAIPNEVKNIILNQSELNIEQGETYKLEATIEPTIATNKTITWGSSNDDIAIIDADGTLTAVNIGECTITATSSNAEVKAECSVKVIPISVKSLELNSTSLNLLTGSNATLQANVLPTNAYNKNITWSTSDASVATVENGVVTGVSAGNATITATSEDGGFNQCCNVTVGGMEIYMSAENGGITTTFTNTGVYNSCKCKISNNSNVDVYVKYISIDGSTLTVDQTLYSYQDMTITINTSSANNVMWTIIYEGVEYYVYSSYNSMIGVNDLFGF